MSNSLSLSLWEKLQLAWLLRGAPQSENDSLIEVAEQLVKQRPDNWLLFYFLGDKYLEEGRYVDALRVCQRCVDLRPNDIRSAYGIATTYNTITRAAWSNEKEMKAVKQLQEPARLLGDKLDPILSQAALDKMDMHVATAAANAIGWFEKALSLEPDRPTRREIKQSLNALVTRFPALPNQHAPGQSPAEKVKESVGNMIATPPTQIEKAGSLPRFDGYMLIGEIDAAITQEPVLSKLPKGSWHSNVTLGRNMLLVEINKDDELLLKDNWGPLADETYWLEIIVPKVAQLLAKRQPGIPNGIKIGFKFNSATQPGIYSCLVDELASAADAVSQPAGSGFGHVMALLSFE